MNCATITRTCNENVSTHNAVKPTNLVLSLYHLLFIELHFVKIITDFLSLIIIDKFIIYNNFAKFKEEEKNNQVHQKSSPVHLKNNLHGTRIHYVCS